MSKESDKDFWQSCLGLLAILDIDIIFLIVAIWVFAPNETIEGFKWIWIPLGTVCITVATINAFTIHSYNNLYRKKYRLQEKPTAFSGKLLHNKPKVK